MPKSHSVMPLSIMSRQELSYHKLGRIGSDLPYLESDEVHTSALELEWDMETELQELGSDQFQADSFTDQQVTNHQNHTNFSSCIQPSISPKGRFQRLQEEPEYFSHYAESETKKSSQHFCTILKMFCTFMFTFILGILIGHFSKRDIFSTNCTIQSGSASSSEINFLSEIVQNISKRNIEKHYRYFTQISVNKTDSEAVKEIALLWTAVGLKEVQLVNYSVLLDLPGSFPNTITLNNGQCYYPNGQQCDEETKSHQSQEYLYSYAAYSAKGTLEGEIIDVQYGTVADLQQVTQAKNVTNSLALLKLGLLPLLYKLSLLEEFGFRGALIYVDPCDLPDASNLNDQSFMVSLNNGGSPFLSDINKNSENRWTLKYNATSLFVQPVAVSLLIKLFSIPETTTENKCLPLRLPEKEYGKLHLQIQSEATYKDVTNVCGFLRGAVLPGKYVLLGSPHKSADGENSQEWASGAAIMTTIIESLMLKVKEGWRPRRTIIFCSWGGSQFGNVGSYKWTEEFRLILESNAVAYIGLQNPVKGNASLHSITSPSLQQLSSEVTKKLQITCPQKEICFWSNISSVQMRGDADTFINYLGIPTAQFTMDNSQTSQLPVSNVLSEALFITKENTKQQLDPFFHLHEYIAKLTLEMVLQIASEPVLPFNALDIALEIQNNIEGDDASTSHLMEKARSLREVVQLFQSNEMRPANDPIERDPTRVRMLNDILKNMEKNFLIPNPPPGFFRNILYRVNEKITRFSTIQEAKDYCKISNSNETLLATLKMVSNCITSAQLYFSESLYVFEDSLDRKG
ncbi:inactive N-acetylated-alpha-linked acidic dipeptidase-like protein 2 [Pelodytes ibericus]